VVAHDDLALLRVDRVAQHLVHGEWREYVEASNSYGKVCGNADLFVKLVKEGRL
jgi:hypothetical protein